MVGWVRAKISLVIGRFILIKPKMTPIEKIIINPNMRVVKAVLIKMFV